MAGENLSKDGMEVAFEQWAERSASLSVDLNVLFRRYRESSIDRMSVLIYC